jgi:predicted Zn finger-like uncharacterized protein
MIIGCPACRTRYLVDEQALGGRAGRTVRCATCGHTWHQSAPPELPAADELSRFEGSRIEPALEVPPRPNITPDASLEVPPRPAAPAAPAMRPTRRRRTGLRWLVLAVLFALAILAGIFVAREGAVKLWPSVARLFARAELSVETELISLA